MNRVWEFLDKIKEKRKDGFLILVLKLLYQIGKAEWFGNIIIMLLSIFIPIAFQSENKTVFWILTGLLGGYYAFIQFCINYKKWSEHRRGRLFRTLELHSETVSSVACFVEERKNWQQECFDRTAEIVCSKVQKLFSNELNIETRTSVEYVFEKDEGGKLVKQIKMVGRQSAQRQNAHRTRTFEGRSHYYVYRIFENNNVGLNRLNTEQINNNDIWFVNKNHSISINEYWGIAVADVNGNVLFVLQIDFLDELVMNDRERKQFVDDYLKLFIQILRLAFLQDNSIIKNEEEG